MANQIRVRRGVKANLPVLLQGEMAYCLDTEEAFIGDGVTNHPLNVSFITIRLVEASTAVAAALALGGDFRVPQALTVLDVGFYVDTAGAGGVTTVDFNENGVSILSTTATVDAGEKTSKTAAIPPVISDSAIAADSPLTFDVDAVPATAPLGLTVWLKVVL